jgi:death-on-curing protein
LSFAHLAYDDILELQQEALELYGGRPGIFNKDGVDAALGAVLQFCGYHPEADILEVAAAYAFYIGQENAFVDGNKRTGLSAALTFLDGNDFSIADDSGPYFDERTLFAGMIGIAAHGWSREDFAELLKCAATQTTFAGILPKVPW